MFDGSKVALKHQRTGIASHQVQTENYNKLGQHVCSLESTVCKVLTEVLMKDQVFWDVTPCRLVVSDVSENCAGSSTARRLV